MLNFLYKMCGLLRKSACLFRQVKTKMYLPEGHFFKNLLAGANGQVLMLDPDLSAVAQFLAMCYLYIPVSTCIVSQGPDTAITALFTSKAPS